VYNFSVVINKSRTDKPIWLVRMVDCCTYRDFIGRIDLTRIGLDVVCVGLCESHEKAVGSPEIRPMTGSARDAFDVFPKAKKLSVDPARIVQIYEEYYRAAWEARAAWERGLFVSRTSEEVSGRGGPVLFADVGNLNRNQRNRTK